MFLGETQKYGFEVFFVPNMLSGSIREIFYHFMFVECFFKKEESSFGFDSY